MKRRIDDPAASDNRSYEYEGTALQMRDEYDLILSLIPAGASVLDLGCGDGTLLGLMKEKKQVRGTGIDISPSGVAAAASRGLDAKVGRIDGGLDLPDDSFDVAVCNVTIQMVEYPERLLSEMKRVARQLIVSFPNFAFYRNRLELLVRGRMPRATLFGYSWYATGHIHQLSYSDFLDLVGDVGGLKVIGRASPPPRGLLRRILSPLAPDLFHLITVVHLARDEGGGGER